MKPKTREFLKSIEGLKFLQWIGNEYGKWDEEEQRYDMPFDECLNLAIEELESLGLVHES